MIALIQRVKRASVAVDGQIIGRIDAGLLAFVAVEKSDNETQVDKLLQKVLNYRVFADDAGKMNRSLKDVGGGLLLVSQFTLAADTNSGLRPSFTPAASPELGRALFDSFVNKAEAQHAIVQTGQFGADMQIELVNDGPVTFYLTAK
jgi:D-aminoacyl-tRNA deacylase